ncbi:CPCC family cysteine-rich protein [Cupriavidus necator]|uniref:CPCC family cysteine-rich protein n=1 Tax=Cupriavidus necator TaxID=106590 RepID=UPI003BEEF0A2
MVQGEDNKSLHLCTCCGRMTLSEIGAFEICDACRPEDDPTQSADPAYAGGAIPPA